MGRFGGVTTACCLAALAAACGGDRTAPEEAPGTVRTVLTDDPVSKFASVPSPSFFFAHHKTFDRNYFHGRLQGRIGISISRFGREWIPLGQAMAIDLTLQVEGVAVELHAPRSVPPGSYSYLRVTVGGGSALLEAGATIDGRRRAEPRALALGGDGEIQVELRLTAPLLVTPGGDVTLGLDLNSESWVSEENWEAGVIPETDVASGLGVTPGLSAWRSPPTVSRGPPPASA